ncbi:MAG: transglutaminase family protein [Verrucomicrobiales bacterium]|nr:transglutaminase family protein [Verrucomicrobiales bacterium]
MSESSAIRYRVEHRTTYAYQGRNDLCHSLAHLRPLENSTQRIVSQELNISPEPAYHSRRNDYFGNAVDYFSVETSHEALSVLSDVVVEKFPTQGTQISDMSVGTWNGEPPPLPKTDDTGIRLSDFLIGSRACPLIAEAREFVRPHLIPGTKLTEIAGGVMSQVYRDFAYTPGATDVLTPLKDVAGTRKGVCQDFAHFMIAGLRSVGIPARYVSGYLETIPPPGTKKLRGADASHAWVEVWMPGAGWVGFDPTNDKQPGNQHIKLAHGRDYFDVQPLRGIFIGSGSQALSVEVDVTRFDKEGEKATAGRL